jgi:tagaturonate reductase
MILSRYNLKHISRYSVLCPEKVLFELPEKVLQFGTGALLRGLPDYFIDKANRKGLFNGRIVVVKSTSRGDAAAFEKQDGLYTLCVRGVNKGGTIKENIIHSAISRVITAEGEWQQVLACAHQPPMQVIISNTTEVGIQLVKEDIRQHPPKSFPAKLLAFLYERYRAFDGSAGAGMTIIPTELIADNGRKLEAIVLELAHLNGLEADFIEWIEKRNRFCNSLVDRIVPGRPDKELAAVLEAELGYADELMVLSEDYRLWAIEGDEKVRKVLSFAEADEGVVIAADIKRFRELKIRLLNGTHTLTCGFAFLYGCTTVKDAMEHAGVATFIQELMLRELVPAIPYEIDEATCTEFGWKVLDRFRNPYLKHQWISIATQYSSKMKMRCIPLLLEHYRKSKTVPRLFALGFAAYLLFTRPLYIKEGKYYGKLRGKSYPIEDDMAEVFYKRWQPSDAGAVVKEVLCDEGFWGANLSELPGFMGSVKEKLQAMMNNELAFVIADEKIFQQDEL